jgi:lysophospholipase L1-like esterase
MQKSAVAPRESEKGIRPRLLAAMLLLAILCSGPIEAIELAAGQPAVAVPLKLAVLGDSISTGAHAEPRETNGYPARLGYLLAPDYEVRAFARSSLCLLRKADLPFAETPEFRAALDWAPDVATIMLGTNDSIDDPRPNWRHHGDLQSDTLHLIGRLREANPKVQVYLLGPPPMIPDQVQEPARAAQIALRFSRLAKVAEVYRGIAHDVPGVFYFDLARTFSETTDGVHPTNFGHESLAREIFERLAMACDEEFDLKSKLESAGLDFEKDRWHGFVRFTFRIDSATCYLVAPHQTAAGAPWIWRARFFDHQPALDLSLLDRGFHLAYCDVSNLYGSDQALDRWDKFYQLATEVACLSRKPILEGMSRGGLPVFFWASRNPRQVAAIYGDNAVCNTRSWPGGENANRSDADWDRLLALYNLSSESASQLPQPFHSEVLRPIAEQQVPVALVLGLADTVVPPTENSLLLADQYRRLGGPTKIWRKPGAGHHPHGLHPPDALRRYLLRAAGYPVNPAIRPVPSVEYRTGAGWGSDWHTAFAHLKQVVRDNRDSELVFLGDSITQGLTGHQQRVAQAGGDRPIDRYFGQRSALSLGLSGDRTEHVLWRLQHGQLEGLTPKTIVLMLGVNNINAAGHTGEETAAGTLAIANWLRQHQPAAKLILLGCFPAGQESMDPRRFEIDRLHEEMASFADGQKVLYRDLRPLFLGPDGRPNERMGGDAIHISRSGQEAWMQAVSEILSDR